jgi:phage gp46-like protein
MVAKLLAQLNAAHAGVAATRKHPGNRVWKDPDRAIRASVVHQLLRAKVDEEVLNRAREFAEQSITQLAAKTLKFWVSCRQPAACLLKIYARVALTTHDPPRYSRLVELFALTAEPDWDCGGLFFRRFAGQSGGVGSAAS